MSSSIVVTGNAELDKKLDALPGLLARRVVRQALRRSASIVRDRAARYAPVRTGALRRSVKIKAWSRAGVDSAMIVVPRKIKDSKKVFYARMVEYGTSKTPAQPYMRPAMEASRSEMLQVFQQEIRSWLSEYRG